MEFPTWVPEAIRAFIETAFEGETPENPGWRMALARANKKLSDVDEEIKKQTHRGETGYLNFLHKHAADALKHRNFVAESMHCLERLGTDERMEEAYTLLAGEFTENRQWCGFIHSAWFADTDYKRYRERLTRTAILRDKIAVSATELAKHLRDAYDIFASDWPDELFSVRELLRQTDNHEIEDRNLLSWRSSRRYVLGDPPKFDIPVFEQNQEARDSNHTSGFVFFPSEHGESYRVDQLEEASENPWYTWEAAPPLSALLETLAAVAENYKPTVDGMIGAAIKKRTQNTRAAYIRAFGHLLINEHNLSLTVAIKKAIAIVTDVVLDGSENRTSYDDVRKTLSNLDNH